MIIEKNKKRIVKMRSIHSFVVIICFIVSFYSGAYARDWIRIDSDEIHLGNGGFQAIINYFCDTESIHYPYNIKFLFFDRQNKDILRILTKTEYEPPLNYENKMIKYTINLIELDCMKRTYTNLQSKYYDDGDVLLFKEEKPYKTESIAPETYFETLRQHLCR